MPYALLPRLRKPSINPGEKIEVEIFITGYGSVKQNKLCVSYSSPLLIDSENPGVLECCIKVAKKEKTGEILSPVSGKQFKDQHKCDSVGAIVGLTEGYFLDIPGESYPDNVIPMVMSEHTWDGMSPILLSLNTSREAPPGDYDIFIALTYSDGKEIQLEQKKVTVHVKSAVERHWRKATIIAIVLSAIAIIVTTFLGLGFGGKVLSQTQQYRFIHTSINVLELTHVII